MHRTMEARLRMEALESGPGAAVLGGWICREAAPKTLGRWPDPGRQTTIILAPILAPKWAIRPCGPGTAERGEGVKEKNLKIGPEAPLQARFFRYSNQAPANEATVAAF